MIIKEYGETNFITGLRFYAATGVLLVHTGSVGLQGIFLGDRITELLAGGVFVFFVISGYSIAQSFTTSRSYARYFAKRLLRITPLYFFWLFFAIATNSTSEYWQTYFNQEIDLRNLIYHITFLSAFEYEITNSILGVEWSIPIEVFFYALVPIFVFIAKRPRWFLISAGVVLASYLVFNRDPALLFANSLSPSLALNWSPVNYILSFLLGSAAFFLRELSGNFRSLKNTLLLVCLFLLFKFLENNSNILGHTYLLLTFLTFTFLIFFRPKNDFFQKILANRFSLFGGSISYGLYLSHFPIIRLLEDRFNLESGSFLLFFLTFLFAILVSTITRLSIEMPIMRVASRFL